VPVGWQVVTELDRVRTKSTEVFSGIIDAADRTNNVSPGIPVIDTINNVAYLVDEANGVITLCSLAGVNLGSVPGVGTGADQYNLYPPGVSIRGLVSFCFYDDLNYYAISNGQIILTVPFSTITPLFETEEYNISWDGAYVVFVGRDATNAKRMRVLIYQLS
jgi:hypothetical protein